MSDDRLVGEAPWQESYRGDYPDAKIFLGLSGIERLRAALRGHGVRPPISHLTGMLLTSVEDERAVFEMPASDWFLSSQDRVSAGALTMLADGSLGVAVDIALPPATPYTTSELSMSFLKPCPPGGMLRSTGRLLHIADPLALSAVWVCDGRGERVAHGTSTCMVLPKVEGIEPPDELPVPEEIRYQTPDPFERPAMGETIPWEQWRTMSGHDLLAAQIAGELPQPPIHYLTGMTLREVVEGSVTFSMPATEWLTSPLRTVQGGAIAMLAQSSISTAVVSTLEAGSAYRPVDVKVNFLRPVFPDRKELVSRGTVVHRGRMLAVATAEVFGTDGRKVATATGSTIILPERPPA